MKLTPPQKKWQMIVKNNTIIGRDGEYLTLRGVESLYQLFLKETRSLEKNPNLVVEDMERFIEITKGVVDSLITVADVMEQTKKAILEKMVAEYQQEFYKKPKLDEE